jgi:nucleolar protein 6
LPRQSEVGAKKYSTMNAKERRKLLRVQQRAVEKETEAPVRNEVELKPKEIKKGEQEVNPQEATSVEGQKDEQQGDVTQLNSKQRRLLLRKQKRDTEGNSNEEKGIQTKPRKKRKRQEIKENKLAPVISVAESNESNDDDNADEKNKKNKIHRTLFVGQLPFKCTEELIRKHFEEAGDIQVRMLTDKKTNKFRGLAFIEVKDNKALGAALSRHHTLLHGRRINVELTAGGGGTKSTKRKEKIETMRKKQSVKQIEKVSQRSTNYEQQSIYY